jgi:hypothetical protein
VHVAAMAPDDPAHRGEPQSLAGEFVLAVQAREGLEQPVGVRHVEAGTIVRHAVVRTPFADLRMDADLGMLDARRELPGIADEIPQQHHRQPYVAPRHHAGLDGDLDAARVLFVAQLVEP